MKITLFCTTLIACATLYTSAEALTITNTTGRKIHFYAYGEHAKEIQPNSSENLSEKVIEDNLLRLILLARKEKRTFHMGVEVSRYGDASPQKQYLTVCGKLDDINENSKNSDAEKLAQTVASLHYEVTFDGDYADPNAKLTCTVRD